MRVVVVNHLTLDGVMQAPGRPDEDRRGGFQYGGWARSVNDPVMAEAMGERMAKGSALLLGRWTYESFAAFWPKQPDNPLLSSDRAAGCLPTAVRLPLFDSWR